MTRREQLFLNTGQARPPPIISISPLSSLLSSVFVDLIHTLLIDNYRHTFGPYWNEVVHIPYCIAFPSISTRPKKMKSHRVLLLALLACVAIFSAPLVFGQEDASIEWVQPSFVEVDEFPTGQSQHSLHSIIERD